MLQIHQLFIYPIKSLGGISVDKAYVTDRGFKYDRRWMLIDENNQFISQRQIAAMSLIKVALSGNNLLVTYPAKKGSITISTTCLTEDFINVRIWDDYCAAQLVSAEADQWFSDMLEVNCRLVYMPDKTLRRVDPEYAPGHSYTSFSDGYPFLIIGQSSLNQLNGWMEEQLTISRFRPNIVFSGGTPFEEDTMAVFTIGNITFRGVKLCARCVITTIDQVSGQKNREPLASLSKYRAKNRKVYFGQNLIHKGNGVIKLGDPISLTERHFEDRFIV